MRAKLNSLIWNYFEVCKCVGKMEHSEDAFPRYTIEPRTNEGVCAVWDVYYTRIVSQCIVWRRQTRKYKERRIKSVV